MVGEEEEPVENSVESTRKESARKADAGSRCRDTGTNETKAAGGEEKVDLRHQLGGSGKAGHPGASSDISLAQLWQELDSGFCFPGCLSIRGPESVWGWERESVSVQCHYDPGWETHQKWWCRGARWASCRILVQTQGSEREEKGARVSIKDHQRNHSFTVTMQELRPDDADTYWCGIENPGANLGTQIKVTVGPSKSLLVYAPGPWCSGLEE